MESLSDYLTGLIALIAVWVAYRQYKIERYRVKLDLFDRRLQLIDDTRRSLELLERDFSLKREGHTTSLEEQHIVVIRAAERRSLYLFSDNEQKYLKSLVDKVNEYERLSNELYSDETTEAKLNHDRSKIIEDLRNKRAGHESKFVKFMTLNQL